MKKFTLLLIAVFSAACLNGYAQTTVSVGMDWNANNSTTVSGTYTMPSIVANTPTILGSGDTEISILSSENISKAASTIYAPESTSAFNLQPTGGGYVEYSLTANSTNKKISTIRVNGSYLKTANTCAILYSDKIPFDMESVIGYESGVSLDQEAVATSSFAGFEATAPDGCKSYRLYKLNKSGNTNLFLIKTSADENPVIYSATTSVPESYDVRLTGADSGNRIKAAFLSATLVEDLTVGIDTANEDDKEVVAVEYFDMFGKKVSQDALGFVIVKTTYNDGTFNTDKKINK